MYILGYVHSLHKFEMSISITCNAINLKNRINE